MNEKCPRFIVRCLDKVLIIGFFVALSQSLPAQKPLPVDWYKSAGSQIGLKAEGWSVDVDDDGFVYWAYNVNDYDQGLDIACRKFDEQGREVWNRAFEYGGGGAQQAYVVNARSDKLYIGGRNCPVAVPECDMLLLQINKATGQLLWDETLDFGQGKYEEVDGLVIKEDGIYCGGWGQALDDGIYRIDIGFWKLDFDGQTLWKSHLGDTATAEHQDGHMVVDDAHIFAAGLWGGRGFGNVANGHCFLGKFSRTDGTLVDSVLFGYQSDNFNDLENALGMTSDGEYLYVTGYTTPVGAGDLQLFVAKFDKDLNLLWFRDWGGTAGETARAIAVTGDRLIVPGQSISPEITGRDVPVAVVLVLSTDGAMLDTFLLENAKGNTFRDIQLGTDALYLSGTIGDGLNQGSTDSAFVVKARLDSLISGTDKPQVQRGVLAYPNPVRDCITMVLPDGLIGPVTVRLFNTSGSEVERFAPAPEDITTLCLDHLSPGTYLYRIDAADGFFASGKVVVQ